MEERVGDDEAQTESWRERLADCLKPNDTPIAVEVQKSGYEAGEVGVGRGPVGR